MRICVLGDAASIHIKKYVDYIVRSGNYCLLISFSKTNITECNNFICIGERASKATGGNFYYLKYLKKIVKIIEGNNIGYINCHYSYSYGLIGTLIKMSNHPVKLSVICHGSDVLVPRYAGLTRLVNKLVFSYADRIIAVSEQIADKLKVYADKVLCLQYGVDESLLQISDEKAIDIISTRAYVENSRNEYLLRSIGKEERIVNCRIKFYMPGIEVSQLDKLRREYDTIDINGGIQHEVLMKEIAKSKIYLCGARSDGTSISLLEAMALGSFPIVYNNESNRSWVIDNVNGFLYRNQNELLDKINIALKNDRLRDDAMIINKRVIFEKGLYEKNMSKIFCYIFY